MPTSVSETVLVGVVGNEELELLLQAAIGRTSAPRSAPDTILWWFTDRDTSNGDATMSCRRCLQLFVQGKREKRFATGS